MHFEHAFSIPLDYLSSYITDVILDVITTTNTANNTLDLTMRVKIFRIHLCESDAMSNIYLAEPTGVCQPIDKSKKALPYGTASPILYVDVV